MLKELSLEFPQFITHIPKNKTEWIKIGYNKLYSGVHFNVRASLISAMHGFIEKHIPDGIKVIGPVETSLVIYAPINFGGMKMILNKKTNKREVQWKIPPPNYKPNWDVGNLATVWLKCLDDVIIKKGILPDDTIEFLRKTSYEFKPVKHFSERKLVYQIKKL